jgi:hypothetical protein
MLAGMELNNTIELNLNSLKIKNSLMYKIRKTTYSSIQLPHDIAFLHSVFGLLSPFYFSNLENRSSLALSTTLN